MTNLRNYMTYINIKEDGGTETLDSFDTRKEAFAMLKEYRMASSYYSGAYLSQRAVKGYN